jgi:uncharacterized protein YhaN
MRIKRLEMKAFGPFSDRVLDFSSPHPGLHVVYGPNEAGKSSSMRALQALLFGFPVRTGDNFLHPYDQLLVGGCLQGADGRELSFFRRKKSKNSLFDCDDNPLDPTALHPFLHGLEQDTFNSLYGIDHDTLVRGGQGILEQQGEVGQALFSAGSGLASLKSILDELEQEGDSLFKPRGSSQAISIVLTQYKELQTQLKQATLSSRDWQEHQHALDDALKKLEELNSLRTGLNREKRQLERLQQALPYLAQRRSLQHKLAELGEVIPLPADFGEQRKALEHQTRTSRSNLEAATIRLADLEERRKGISVHQGLLDHMEEIEELHQGLGQYRKARADRPLLEGRRIGCRTDAADLLQQIRPGMSLDQIETVRPSLAKRKTIQTLGARHEALVKAVQKAERQVQGCTSDLATARADLAQLSPLADAGKLPQAVLQAQKAGDLDAMIMAQTQLLDRSTKGCTATLQRLGHWGGPYQTAPQLAIPLAETVRRFEERFSSLDQEQRQLLADRSQLEAGQTQLCGQLRELEYAAELPTEEDLALYREKRDQGWQLLRRQWLQQEDIAQACLDYDPDQPLPEAYEKQVLLADQTADRLYREADRVQQHASLKARIDGINHQLTELAKQEEQRTGSLTETTTNWQNLWAPCGITPLPPREMQAWLNGFDKLLFQVTEAEKLTQEQAALKDKRHELRAAVLAELAALTGQPEFPGETLSPVLQHAETLLQRMQADQSRRETLERRISDLERLLATVRQDQVDAEKELGQWQSLWQEALAPLGIESRTLPAEALDFIETLQVCFEKLKEAGEFSKRIEGIDRDAVAFEEEVRALCLLLAPELADLDTPQAVAQLKTGLGRANQDQTLLQQYHDESTLLETARLEAHTGLARLDEQLADLRRLSGCQTDEQLYDAEWRSCELLKLQEKQEEVEDTLVRLAEGVALAELDQQAQTINPDDLPGRLEWLTTEIEGTLDPAIRQVSETIGREKNELARMDGSARAAELAESSQQLLARIRHLTERFIRVKLATKLLREEIERYRAENQDPVLKIASRYFNQLTLGSCSGLRTDLDDQGQPVLIGIRPNGAWLQVAGMSSGTRDQLYLALRLATLEWRMQSSEPLPFIVDDILINFDDNRSKATLQALVSLAEKTQVILFTHHNQIEEAARSLQLQDKIAVHQL